MGRKKHIRPAFVEIGDSFVGYKQAIGDPAIRKVVHKQTLAKIKELRAQMKELRGILADIEAAPEKPSALREFLDAMDSDEGDDS
jgi:hypothetical protein